MEPSDASTDPKEVELTEHDHADRNRKGKPVGGRSDHLLHSRRLGRRAGDTFYADLS